VCFVGIWSCGCALLPACVSCIFENFDAFYASVLKHFEKEEYVHCIHICYRGDETKGRNY
jgi:hypothetical protein